MAKIRNIILIAILLMTVITACSKSPEEKARNALRQVNIEYSENSFIKYVEKGDKAVVDLFLTAGMSPDAKSEKGISALTIAVRSGHIEMVTLLLAKGVDVNAKDKDGFTALMEAVRVKNVEVVKILIDKGADVNAKDIAGNTALTIATSGGHTEMVNLLIAKGADVNAKDKDGFTALMEAARLGNIEVVKVLIDKGADVNAKNNAGLTALMIAKNKTWPDIVNILEKAGATIPKELIEGLLTVADSQWQKEDYQNAIESYKEILSLDPNNSKAKEFLKKYSAVRFIFSDLTIKDINTRLMWTRDANIAGRKMDWYKANDYIKQLNGKKYGGYSDWRLPTIKEFQTLVKQVYGQHTILNKGGFKKVQGDFYWSSSPNADYPKFAWAFNVSGGYVGSDGFGEYTTNTCYVWPVRAPMTSYAAGAEWFVFSDLTATDKKTGLMWTKNANLAGEKITWNNAFKFIEKLNKQKYAGYSDWRLPTNGELQTLAAYAHSNLTFYELFTKIGFENVQPGYWSSTTYTNTEGTTVTGVAWEVYMDGGYEKLSYKTPSYVWPVRAGR